MKQEILDYLYKNEAYLTYLRYHPKWYELLASNPSLFPNFLNTVKKDLKLTSTDKMQEFSKQITFLANIFNYLKK